MIYSFTGAGVSNTSTVPDIRAAPQTDSGFPLIVAFLILVYMFLMFSLMLSSDSLMELSDRA